MSAVEFGGRRRRILIPQPRSRFLLVTCPQCGQRQVAFSHATFPARCLSCGAPLIQPVGGKARVLGKIERVLG